MHFQPILIISANSRIQETIRRLLHLIPSDPSIIDVLDKVAIGRFAASSCSAAATFDATSRSTSANVFGSSSFNRSGASGGNASPLKSKILILSYLDIFQSIFYTLYNCRCIFCF